MLPRYALMNQSSTWRRQCWSGNCRTSTCVCWWTFQPDWTITNGWPHIVSNVKIELSLAGVISAVKVVENQSLLASRSVNFFDFWNILPLKYKHCVGTFQCVILQIKNPCMGFRKKRTSSSSICPLKSTDSHPVQLAPSVELLTQVNTDEPNTSNLLTMLIMNNIFVWWLFTMCFILKMSIEMYSKHC